MNKIVSHPLSLFLKRTAEGMLDEVQDTLRYPGTLRRILKNGRLTPAIPRDTSTIWRKSLTSWHQWLQREKNHISFYYPVLSQSYHSYQRHIPEMDNLFSQAETANYPIDITDITGMSASHDSDCNVSDIDEFAVLCCQKQIQPVTPANLQDNMSHHGLRLTEMNFERCSWSPGRLYWNNSDGSHHLAAARYQAKKLGIKIPLNGSLTVNTCNRDQILPLVTKWDLYLVNTRQFWYPLGEAIEAMRCPYGISEAPPREYWGASAFHVIWLERNQRIPARVSRVLSAAGFISVSQQLRELL